MGGVIQKHQYFVHLTIPISLHEFQAVRNEHEHMDQWSNDMTNSSKVSSSNPTIATAKCHSASDVKLERLNRCGAEAARETHNLEDRCSNHLTGILSIRQLCRSCLS